MKILLIGPGYVGTHLLTHWQDPHDRFIAFTTTREKIEILEKLPLVEKALVNDLEEVLLSCDGVIICVAPKDGGSYEKTYLDIAQTLQAFIKNRTKPLHLIYTSSTSVYGQHTSDWIDETTQPNLLSPKATILLETEKVYLSCGRKGISICILRLGGIYGPKRDLLSRAHKLSGQEMPGSGDQPTNHSHVEDIGYAIEFCFKHKIEGVYNLVSDAHPSRKTLYHALCKQEGVTPPKWNPLISQAHGSNSKISNEKIKKMGFEFSHPDLETRI